MNTNCLNCGHEYQGKFCSQCGQKSHTARITLGSILHDIPHSVFHLDKGFAYTFIQLLTRPGKAMRDYIDGKRMPHYSPFAYLFILSAASSLMSHLRNYYFETYRNIIIRPSAHVLFPEVAHFFRQYLGLMFCLLIPFISFWSWLFNRDSKYNYWENLVMNTYLIAQFNVFLAAYYLLFIFTGFITPSLTPILTVFFCYTGIAYYQFFQSRMSFGSVLKRILMFIAIVLTLLTGLTLTGFMTRWWW